MKNNFVALQRFCLHYYPDIVVQGELYPPPSWAVMLAQTASALQIVGMVMMFMGGRVFAYMGMPEPPVYVWMTEHKLQTTAFLFFGNNIAASQMATGAFEVYLDGALVFSKLETKTFPSKNDIFRIMEKHGVQPDMGAGARVDAHVPF